MGDIFIHSDNHWGKHLFCCLSTFASSILLSIFTPTCFFLSHISIASSTRIKATSILPFRYSLSTTRGDDRRFFYSCFPLKLKWWRALSGVTLQNLSVTALLRQTNHSKLFLLPLPQGFSPVMPILLLSTKNLQTSTPLLILTCIRLFTCVPFFNVPIDIYISLSLLALGKIVNDASCFCFPATWIWSWASPRTL